MGRGGLDGLGTRHPLAAGVPAVYREPPPRREGAGAGPEEPSFVDALCAALDEVLAPVFVTFDALEAYVDPRLAPPDFLRWLLQWVTPGEAIELSEEAARDFLGEATQLYRRQGTAWALTRWVELYTGGEVEVTDNGGSLVAGDPTSTVVFDIEPPRVLVRVRVARTRADEHLLRGLRALVAWAAPAHVLTDVEVHPS